MSYDWIRALAVLDIIPILDMAERLTYEAARHMGHWFWVAQPSRVPETLIGLDPVLYVRHIIEQWGGSDVVESQTVDEYVRCMRNLRCFGSWVRSTVQIRLISNTTEPIEWPVVGSRARCSPYGRRED